MSNEWRILLVEDMDDIAAQVEEALKTFFAEPESAHVERQRSFGSALQRLQESRFDILILDLKDDQDTSLEEDDVSAGLKIFEALKASRFAPVIFYTAHAHKVRDLESPFVRVVEKTEGIEKLHTEIKKVMSTRLPKLSRLIEEIQREYMWDFVSTFPKEFDTPETSADVSYLLARRLAATLELSAASLTPQAEIDSIGLTTTDIHPMQMYVYPPLPQLQGGDIIRGKLKDIYADWIVLTPTCDLVQCKAENILLAKCMPLTATDEYVSWSASSTNKTEEALLNLLGDNRKSKKDGPKFQPDRFKYLPGTFFVGDLIVDFQEVASVALSELEKLERVACLDSPFAEALLGRFTRYYGRLGTPDINKSAVIGRLKAMPEKTKQTSVPAASPPAAAPA